MKRKKKYNSGEAEVFGGPDDGAIFYTAFMEEGSLFTPSKTSVSNNRPIYKYEGKCFRFIGWDSVPTEDL